MYDIKSIKFYGNYYCKGYYIDTDGNVYSLRLNSGKLGKVLKKRKFGSCGKKDKILKYHNITFSNFGNTKTYTVHRLVLETFVGSCPEGMEACHIDGNSLNNKLTNLKWDTKSRNELDKYKTKTDNRGSRNGRAKLNEHQVKIIKKLLSYKVLTHMEISKIFDMSKSIIDQISINKCWKHI